MSLRSQNTLASPILISYTQAREIVNQPGRTSCLITNKVSAPAVMLVALSLGIEAEGRSLHRGKYCRDVPQIAQRLHSSCQLSNDLSLCM